MNVKHITAMLVGLSVCSEMLVADDVSRQAVDLDVFRVAGSITGGMDLKGATGDLEVSRFDLRAILSQPIRPLDGMMIVPLFNYSATDLNFSGTAPGFPIQDEGLHSISFSAFLNQDFGNSPWFGIGYTRAELATDFQHLTADALTFDLAAGIGYRFSEYMSLGLGVAVLNLNGDVDVYPGLFFAWAPCNGVRLGIYGPNLVVSYQPNESWMFSFIGEPGGGDWNFRDETGNSRTIDLSSYRLGLYAKYRLAGELWVGAGVGMTVGNEIELRDNRGGNRFKRDMDEAAFGEVFLSMYRW